MHSGVIKKGLWSHLTCRYFIEFLTSGSNFYMSEKCKRRQCSAGLNVILLSLCQSSHPIKMLPGTVLQVSTVSFYDPPTLHLTPPSLEMFEHLSSACPCGHG